MYPEAYRAWIELFDDDFSKIWQSEPKDLQKVSLLLCALRKEINNIQTNIEVEVLNLKRRLKYRNDLEKKVKLPSPPIGNKKLLRLNITDKENDKGKDTVTHSGDFASKRDQCERESPDLFRNIDVNTHSSPDTSIIDLSISEDDPINLEGSPTIKKRRKRHRVIANPPAFGITENEEKSTTPISTAQKLVKTNLFKTPVAKSDHDISVIECTSEVVSKRSKTRAGSLAWKRKSKNRKINNSTLTQMFRNASERRTNETTEEGVDSDETFFDGNVNETKLGITELINYINRDDSKNQENVTRTSNRGDNEGEVNLQELETSSQEVDQFSKGAIFNEEDLRTSSEKPKAIAIEPEPVVRGKARKQLHGWSCQQCKNFYGQMKLGPEELQKKMDECSRHRYKYNPPEETMPGFWDLSIPPEPIRE